MTLQAHEIPIVTIIDDSSDRAKGISHSIIYELGVDDAEDVFVDLSTYDIENTSLVDTIIEFVTSNMETSYNDFEVVLLMEGLKALDTSVLEELWLVLKNQELEFFEVELFINSYLQTIIDGIVTSYRINIGTIPTNYDTDVDMYIWGTNFFNINADVFCANEPYYPTLPTDIQQALGRLTNINSDIFSAVQANYCCTADIFNTIIQEQLLKTDIITQSGRLQPIGADVFSTNLGLVDGISTDFKIRSLFTSDFFIEQDKFTTVSSVAWVDVVDFLYPIDIANTYLEVDGTLASGIWFEDIPNGKRLYYNPLNDFYSDGVITYSLHAESVIGEVEDKNFYLLYGYNLEPNEVIDWGPSKTVVVRVEAQNLLFCPNKVGEAFDFTTADLSSFNLKCKIRPVGYVDLPVSIFPQSATFFYGSTYTVRVSGVKDFSGNVMPDFEYTFTIESPD